jgi:ankyrin repeat protein
MISAAKGQGFTFPAETNGNITWPATISNESFLSCIKLLLSFSDADVNVTDTEGLSALSLACSWRFFEAVDELQKYPDINVNCKSRDGSTPFILACRSLPEEPGSGRSDALKCVRLLLDRTDIDINAVNSAGNTALLTATNSKFSDCVDLLLSVEGIDVNVANSQGLSALDASVSNGTAAIAKKLLSNATINKNIAKISSFVLVAVKNNYKEVLEVLLSIDELSVNERGAENETPLVTAIRTNRKECIQLLLADKRVDVNVQVFAKYAAPNISNYSDLPVGDTFVTNAHSHPLRLISSVALMSTTTCSKCSTVFHPSMQCSQCVNGINCYTCCPDCTSQARGPQTNAPKMLKSTLLMDAIANKNNEISKLLLGRDDIDINACDDDGNTALIIATSMNVLGLLMNEKLSPPVDPMASLISMILSKAVDINWSNANGHAALQYACAKNRIETVTR